MGLHIGPRQTEPGHVCLIAEAGVNHNGSVERALRMVEMARESGADAVKFQVFTAQALVQSGARTAAYQRQASGQTDQNALLADLELTHEDFARIAAHCHDCGIEFLATPFDPLEVEFLVQLGVPAIKIASPDLTYRPLVRAAFATNLPVLLATGAAQTHEMDQTVTWFRELRTDDDLVLLHCVSAYPTPDSNANLRRVASLRERFGLPVGYSDHTRSLDAGGLAVALGACVVEKHFTLDRSLPGPDHAMSLAPADLTRYVAQVRRAQTLLGDGSLDHAPLERDVRRVARRSIVAVRDIPAGHNIEPEMLACKRPAGGIDPCHLDDILRRRTRCDVPAGTALSWEMLAQPAPRASSASSSAYPENANTGSQQASSAATANA